MLAKEMLVRLMVFFFFWLVQISYGRFSVNPNRNCEVELFIMHGDGEKIVDPSKQEALSSVLKTELQSPLRAAVVNRGPDTELLVANPVELSRRGRPLVFYDITLALETLNSRIFSVLFQFFFRLSVEDLL